MLDVVDVIIALVISVVLHELAHGVVALWLSDTTARRAGRLTLNPLKHVDPLGSVAVPLILAVSQLATIHTIAFTYGWAKPVPVDPMALRLNGERHPRQLMALVAVAGPLMNLALALLGGVLLHFIDAPQFLMIFILLNLTLGIFNLLPVPPMDGGRIAVGILPLGAAKFMARAERFGIVAVLLVLFVLPAALEQFGIYFNPFRDAMGVVLPWAERGVLWAAGFGHGV